MNVTVMPYDRSIYRPGTKSGAGECTWGAPCGRPARWSVIEHQSNGVDSRWATCDLHNPESE